MWSRHQAATPSPIGGEKKEEHDLEGDEEDERKIIDLVDRAEHLSNTSPCYQLSLCGSPPAGSAIFRRPDRQKKNKIEKKKKEKGKKDDG